MTTRHPCHERICSRTQVQVFEQIAIGQYTGHSRQTLDALLRKGLIRQAGKRQLGWDRFGPIEVTVYEVPLPLHIQWCQWCDETVE